MASMAPATFALASLDAIRLFVEANGRAIFYDSVEITSMRVRDARDALMLLPEPRPQGAARLLPPSPPRDDAPRPINVSNRPRVSHLATAGFMLESTDMILDDLLREVEARRVVQEHVEGLRCNAQVIIDRVVRHDPAFFSFVDDVAKEMRGVADKLKPPCRNFAQLRYALQSLKTDVNALQDRDVVLSTPRTDLPSPGPAVILATGAGPSVEPLAVDEEEEVPAYEKTLALDEDDEEVAASEKTLALDEDDEEVAASEKTLALEEKAAASEKQKAPALEEKAAASENEMTLTNADPEAHAASENEMTLTNADPEAHAASENEMTLTNADPEAHAASVATADAFLPGSTDGPAPDAAGVDDDDVA